MFALSMVCFLCSLAQIMHVYVEVGGALIIARKIQKTIISVYYVLDLTIPNEHTANYQSRSAYSDETMKVYKR